MLDDPHDVNDLSRRLPSPAEIRRAWVVVGGAGRGGIIVRKGADLTSPQIAQRLRTGAIVSELSLSGGRLHNKLAHGQPCEMGPVEGWVSIKMGDKELLQQSVSLEPRDKRHAWLEELLSVYAGKPYQVELHRSWAFAADLTEKANVRWELHLNAQQILQAKLGHGSHFDIFRSSVALKQEHEPSKYVARLLAWIAWFCNPAAQAVHIGGPPMDHLMSTADDMLRILVDSNPCRLPNAKVMAKAPLKVCKASVRVFGALSGDLLCTFDASFDDHVRHLKSQIRRLEGTSMHQQQLVAREQRLVDMQKVRDLIGADQSSQGEYLVIDLVLLRHDAEKADKLRQLEYGQLNLWDLPPTMESDNDFALAALRRTPLAIKFGSSSFRSNRDLMMCAVQLHGEVLEYASNDLLQDRALVLMAVAVSGNSLRFASPSLQNDPEVVLTAVEQEGMALQHASVEMQANRPIVLAAVERRGQALTFASSALQADPDVVLTALHQTLAIVRHVSEEVRMNESFLQRLEHSSLDPDGSLLDCLMWVAPETAHEWQEASLALFVDVLDEVSWQWSEQELEWRERVELMPAFRMLIENPQLRIVVYSDHGGAQSWCIFVARGLRRHPNVSAHRVWRLEQCENGAHTVQGGPLNNTISY